MALKSRSLFIFGLQVSESNRSIDFRIAPGGDEKQATLPIGYYSLSGLLVAIKSALEVADLTNTYTVTADRTVSGGQENRITIATSGSHFELLFATGTRSASAVASLVGFTATDKTGATTYTSTSSAGQTVVSPFPGNAWKSPAVYKKNFGVLNITPTGRKEAIVYSTQRFWQVRFEYIPESQLDSWVELMTWLISQKEIDFTPEIAFPEVFYQGSLEGTPDDPSGLAFSLNETPRGTGLYDTGVLKFRVKE